MHLSNVILAVAVRVENEFLLRVLKARDQRRSVAEVLFVMNYAQARPFPRETVQDGAGFAFAAITDHQHFEIVGYFAHLLSSSAHNAFDGVLIVICRKESAD